MTVAVAAPVEALLTIAQRFGTPTYAYDVDQIARQVTAVQAQLPASAQLLYSLKANPALGIAGLMAHWGLGADVASAGELATASAAGFASDRIFVSGPYKSPELLTCLAAAGNTTLSVDSVSELAALAATSQPWRVVLRLRPDFASAAAVDAGVASRFGIPLGELPACRTVIAGGALRVIGFHVFAGSQILAADAVIHHLRAAARLCLQAADALAITAEVFNLGGGFGVPYAHDEPPLDLASVGEELTRLVAQVRPATVMLELGRYLVAQAGWYLTRVVAYQEYGAGAAVVVDGGTHQRADLCGLGLTTRALPPIVLIGHCAGTQPTAVLGCLCLPADVLTGTAALPPLALGDVLAFPNAGAYGLTASPALFLGHPLPAEVAFSGTEVALLRPRVPADGVLTGQQTVSHLSQSRTEVKPASS